MRMAHVLHVPHSRWIVHRHSRQGSDVYEDIVIVSHTHHVCFCLKVHMHGRNPRHPSIARVMYKIRFMWIQHHHDQGRYEIYQVIADMLSIMIDNTTKRSNLSTILISIETPVCTPRLSPSTAHVGDMMSTRAD